MTFLIRPRLMLVGKTLVNMIHTPLQGALRCISVSYQNQSSNLIFTLSGSRQQGRPYGGEEGGIEGRRGDRGEEGG